MLRLENVSSGYNKRKIIKDISLSIEPGINLLVGFNASGKSTLLKTVYGLIKPMTGRISFFQEDITEYTVKQRLLSGMLYLPQSNQYFSNLTIKENLEIASLLLPKDKSKARINEALEKFPILSTNLNKTPFSFSGGEGKILGLAMAALHHPKLIMLDEPLAGLSTKAQSLVIRAITDLNTSNNVSFVIVEHKIKEMLQVSDKVLVLKEGCLEGIYEAEASTLKMLIAKGVFTGG